MIGFVLRGLVVLWLLTLELWLVGRHRSPVPDVSALLVAFCVLELRARRTPYVVLPLALGRALLLPGSCLFHLWLLLVAWTVMLPVRRLLFVERWQLRIFTGAGVACILSLVQARLLTGGQEVLARAPLDWLLTGLVTPGVLLLLPMCYRNLVPERALQPTSEVGA